MANCVVVEVRGSLEHPSSGDLAVKETKHDQGKFKIAYSYPIFGWANWANHDFFPQSFPHLPLASINPTTHPYLFFWSFSSNIGMINPQGVRWLKVAIQEIGVFRWWKPWFLATSEFLNKPKNYHLWCKKKVRFFLSGWTHANIPILDWDTSIF